MRNHYISLYQAAQSNNIPNEQWQTITVHAIRQSGGWDLSYMLGDVVIHRGIYPYPDNGIFLGGANATITIRDVLINKLDLQDGWQYMQAMQARREVQQIKRPNPGDTIISNE